MKKETKFDLGDTVFFVGNHKIYEAIIIEVRVIERYVKVKHDDTSYSFSPETLELYRLAECASEKSEFANCDSDHIPKYKGEYENFPWFTPDILFCSAYEALESIEIHCIVKNKSSK